MTYNNSRIYCAIPVTINESVPTSISITTDGILPIYPIQWTDTNIPVFFSLTDGDCTTLMHYASGDFDVASSLDSYCAVLSTEGLTALSIFPVSSYCMEGGFYKTTFMIPSSAIPESEIITEIDQCTMDVTSRNKYRKAGINARIYATGTFNVGGIEYNLEGYSDPFTIYRLENYYDFRKTNENQKLSDILKDNFPRFKQDETRQFWDDYINGSLGGEQIHEINYSIPEKIANLTTNIADIDTSEINALYNIAEQNGITLDQSPISFPSELQRVMNFVSIPHSKLFGFKVNDWEEEYIKDVYDNSETSLLGDIIEKDSVLSEERQIFFKHKSSHLLLKYYVDENDLGLTLTQALSSTTETLYPNTTISEFCFYETFPYEGQKYTENIIDYDNYDNWLPELNPEEWLGENNAMEEIINYTLTKNLS